jgi:hypothetical protein
LFNTNSAIFLLYHNIRLVSRNGDSSNVNEQIQINDNIYIYDEINDLDLDEMDTTNTLSHELTSGASIIDIDDMDYEMPSKWMTVLTVFSSSTHHVPFLWYIGQLSH